MATILILDDNRYNIFAVEQVLKEEGYEVLSAETGMAGLQIAVEKTPDVILLDVHMPRLNGFEICRKLKEQELTRDIPVLFMTAIYKDTQSLVKGLEVGGEDYITIPFEPQELKARVKVLVRLKHSIDQLNQKNEELTRLNKELIRANNFMNSIMDWSNYAICIGDLSGKILNFNEGIQKIFGYSLSEIKGSPIEILFPPSYRRTGKVEKILETTLAQGRYEGEVENMRRDGAVFPVWTSVTLRRDEEGNPMGFVSISRDISREKEMESMIQRQHEEIQALRNKYNFEEIIGNSEKMIEILKIVEQLSNSTDNTSVLILGESGTGKELIARAIHHNSRRKQKPFVTLNCSALPESLIESELFGYEKGAFTGASLRKIGLIEAANGGTLFLDEIGDMSPMAQVKLLRVLQEGELRRIGGNTSINVDVRFIAASNKDLDELVKEGKFREDLFYRLNVIKIEMPPLRERREDIPLLVDHFIKEFSKKTGKKIREISPEALNLLINYKWLGNVRQLRNVIEAAVVMAKKEVITTCDLPVALKSLPELPEEGLPVEKPPASHEDFIPFKLGTPLHKMEKLAVEEALRKTPTKVEAAKLLGITRHGLDRRIKKYGIQL